MVYVKKIDRDRRLWMLLGEAVQHIKRVESCENAGAISQLRQALVDGELQARWASDDLPGSGFTRPRESIFADDAVPTDPMYWSSVLLLSESEGHVIDQNIISFDNVEPRVPRRRKLYLLREEIEKFWPSGRIVKAPKSALDRTKLVTSPAKIREELRDIYNSTDARPNMERAWKQLKKRLPGARRGQVRIILKEFEFSSLRRSPGRAS